MISAIPPTTRNTLLLAFLSINIANCDEVDIPADLNRSPVDLVVSNDGTWLVTANQTSHSVSLVDIATGTVLDEQPVGRRPVSITLTSDGHTAIVSSSESGDLTSFSIVDRRLLRGTTIHIGFEPQGIAVTKNGRSAYVARLAKNDVVRVDLRSRKIDQTISVGKWPRHLALSPDERRLAVGTSGDGGISVVDTESATLKFIEPAGINIGHLATSVDNKYVYFPWMIYRSNPITTANIRRGWVLGSRIARVRLDESARREAITLDPRGEAVADPHGIALSSDETTLVVSASGTQEVLVFDRREMPFIDFGGPGDHIDQKLLNNSRLFWRLTVGGRPMGIRMSPDQKQVIVANYLLNSVQVIDLARRKIVQNISLGGPDKPSLPRRGEAIFFDARFSLDQWYSCHSCHYEGGSNSVTMDTFNDGTVDSFKTVLPLYNVTQTSPWTWHGWQQDLRAGIHKSITSTMHGPSPTKQDTDAVIAFLRTLSTPPNSMASLPGPQNDAAQRGKAVFHSDRAQCNTCHSGTYFTDGEIHDVGLGSEDDHFVGHNTPSLLGVGRKVMWLHDGRAKTLRELLIGPHSPTKVSESVDLTEQEIHDLVAYLETL